MTPCGSAPALDLGVVDGPLGNSVAPIGWPGGPVAASLQGSDRSGATAPRQDIALPRFGGVSSRYCCGVQDSYLVDSASSHMLVSKIKPCMSKYKQLYTVKLRTAHYISYNLFDGDLLHG